MKSVLRRVAVPLVAFAALAGMAGTANADVISPIGPDQFFTGLVNGQSANAVIATDCTGTGVGHPVNAHVSVNRIFPPTTSTVGYTGDNGNSIIADLEFPPAAAITNEEIGTLTFYGQSIDIPSTFIVPCTGTGTVAFLPAPSSGNARVATVDVRFVPIVASAGSSS